MDNSDFSVHYPPGVRTLPTQTRTLPTEHIRNLLIFKDFFRFFRSKSFKTYKNFFLKPFCHVENTSPAGEERATSGRTRPGFQSAHSALPGSTSSARP